MKFENVLITGSSGFLGKAVIEEFKKNNPDCKLHTFRSNEYDLRERDAVRALLNDRQIDIIIHLAASVGGIGANQKNPGKFLYDNLIMGVQLIEEARLHKIKKFVAVGTICSYPKFTPVPFSEDQLWNGYPEETNAPYGLAKRMLIAQLQAYKQQYGFHGVCLLPVNLYGPNDHFNLENSHVIPAMIRKFHDAKVNLEPAVTFWGDGSPTREFLFVEDGARAIRLATEKYNSPLPVNLGTGKEISMLKLAETLKRVIEFNGEIIWDKSKPNGQPRRCLDVTRAKEEFGFTADMSLAMGLRITYEWFVSNYQKIIEQEKKEKIDLVQSNNSI